MNTKEKIVAVAIKLFNEQGTTSVTTNHIAAGAGISPGNLYYHFRNKEEIIRNIFAIISQIKDTESSYGQGFFVNPPVENLELLFREIMMFHWEYRFFFRELNTLLNRDAELKTLFIKKQASWLREIKSTIHGFIEAGIFKPIDEQTVDYLHNNIWMIGISWHAFLDSKGKKITKSGIEQGIEMMRSLLKPYLN